MYREYAVYRYHRYNSSILTTIKKMSDKKARLRLAGKQVLRES